MGVVQRYVGVSRPDRSSLVRTWDDVHAGASAVYDVSRHDPARVVLENGHEFPHGQGPRGGEPRVSVSGA